jgi:hypothetical protein
VLVYYILRDLQWGKELLMFAIVELYHILLDAWQAADLPGHLGEWWWVVTHRHLLDGPPPAKEAADAG